jgi:hypothetical protein
VVWLIHLSFDVMVGLGCLLLLAGLWAGSMHMDVIEIERMMETLAAIVITAVVVPVY